MHSDSARQSRFFFRRPIAFLPARSSAAHQPKPTSADSPQFFNKQNSSGMASRKLSNSSSRSSSACSTASSLLGTTFRSPKYYTHEAPFRHTNPLSLNPTFAQPPPPLSQRPIIHPPQPHPLPPPSFNTSAARYNGPNSVWPFDPFAAAVPRSSPAALSLPARFCHLGEQAKSWFLDDDQDEDDVDSHYRHIPNAHEPLNLIPFESPGGSAVASADLSEVSLSLPLRPSLRPTIFCSHWSYSTSNSGSDDLDSLAIATPPDSPVSSSDVAFTLRDFVAESESGADADSAADVSFPERKIRSSKWQNFSHKSTSPSHHPPHGRSAQSVDTLTKSKRHGVIFGPSRRNADRSLCLSI